MLRSFTADLAAAWLPVSALELELVKQETNPRLVQLGGPLESVVVVRFIVGIRGAQRPHRLAVSRRLAQSRFAKRSPGTV